jgi:hypothetical protein
MVRECPKCRLVNPQEAQRCDCGYDFVSSTMEQSYLKAGERPRASRVTGAVAGALVGGLARGAVVLLNFGTRPGGFVPFALPSATIGLLVGGIAGAFCRPLLGAVVGAVLSGVVFELFMTAGASMLGYFNPQRGTDFMAETLIYGLEMAVAGALAGGVGGLIGKLAHPSR